MTNLLRPVKGEAISLASLEIDAFSHQINGTGNPAGCF